jgi:hypothetical protein
MKVGMHWEMCEIAIYSEESRARLFENPTRLDKYAHGVARCCLGFTAEEAFKLAIDLLEAYRSYHEIEEGYLQTFLKKQVESGDEIFGDEGEEKETGEQWL